MRCLNCDYEIETDDNFCPNCGHWTTRGYTFLKNEKNVNNIMNESEIKKNSKLSILFSILSISTIIFVLMLIVRGNALFKPLIYVKKIINSYKYGYNISVIDTKNNYKKINVRSIDDAHYLIKNDFDSQRWKCIQSSEINDLEKNIEEKYSITSVMFCDISFEEASKIKEVIDNMYKLFPTIKGGLTNITISNTESKSEYIAFFQPMYQFINSNEDIHIFNKVNKTQILINSYYFLNNNFLQKNIEEIVGVGWYVNDATWESTIAHELGHYITFKLFLKENNLDSITFINENNSEYINQILKNYDSGTFSSNILNEAINNYNKKYNLNIEIEEYVKNISKYASIKDEKNKIMVNETIAEAIHDYYLHGNNCKKESYEIVNIIKSKL